LASGPYDEVREGFLNASRGDYLFGENGVRVEHCWLQRKKVDREGMRAANGGGKRLKREVDDGRRKEERRR
jgi:hypothetical protein